MERTPTAPPRLLAALAFCALALGAAPARAATLHVSPSGSDNNAGTAAAPYATVQAAVNNANAGDTIALGAGTYAGSGNRDIDFGGKALTVRSDGGAGVTVIDCGGSEAENHRGFYFHGKQAGARVEGLTIKNGFPNNGQTLTFGGSQGGAAFIERDSAAAFKNCTFTANGGVLRTGGSIDNEGRVTLTGCAFLDNPSSGLRNWGTAIVTGCTFRGNTAATGAGIMNAGELTVGGSTFTDNACDPSDGAGGGLFIRLSAFGGIHTIVTDCTFTGNRAHDGGGVCGQAVTLTGCTFAGNTAESGGGASLLFGGATLSRCVFTGNRALTGGGLFVGNRRVALTNCAFAGNVASDGDGGGIASRGALTMRFCSLGGNTAGGTGDGGHVKRGAADEGQVPQGGGLENDGSAVLTDCILWGNAAPDEAQIGTATAGGPTTAADHCDIQGGLSGAGNLKADPRFAGPADLHLQPGSPCRGVGVAIAGVTTDAGGKHRTSPPSIGAYQ